MARVPYDNRDHYYGPVQNSHPLRSNLNVTVSTQPTSPGRRPAQSPTAVHVHGRRGHQCSGHLFSWDTFPWRLVSGYSGGTGFALQNNGGDTLTINEEWRVHVPTLVPSTAPIMLRFLGSLSGPNQTCTVSLGKGTATANVTNVSVYARLSPSINVTVVGLGANGAMQLLAWRR